MVVGAGGTGSHVLNGLVQLHTAMIALGHPGGLQVTAIDDDTVSESNVGRQAVVWSDIGQPKATVLINRLNMAFGLNWQAEVKRVKFDEDFSGTDIVIGCVDNRAARKVIAESAPEGCYWLDIGNSLHQGQVVLGEIPGAEWRFKGRDRLPTVADLYPETVDPSLDETDDIPSCSLADALEKQGLFVNRGVAVHALNLLWQLCRHGKITHHALFVNMAAGRVTPLPVDPEAWKRLGYSALSKAA